MDRSKKLLYGALALSILPLLGWWTYGLFDLDEGFYAAVTAEMNRRHEWITPFYDGVPWFEKPILSYWAAKPFVAIFGDAVGPRFPSVLATFATYALVGWFAKRRFGVPTAALSVVMLASSLLTVALGRMMMTDPLLVLTTTGAFLTFWESIEGDKRWRLATAFCLGLGVLAKGPIAGILFVPVAFWVWWRYPDVRERFKGYWPEGICIFVLIVASWYLPALIVNGKVFVQKFLVEQNIGRFSGGDQAHNVRGLEGLIYYLPVILLGFFPWSLLLPRALLKKPEENSALIGYLKAWIVVVFAFFTITSAKLPHYMLPMGPAIALLIGQWVTRAWKELKLTRYILPAAWLLFVAIFAEFGFYSWYNGVNIGGLELPGDQAEIHRLTRYVKEHEIQTDEVAEYKMGHQKGFPSTSKFHIDETSHPSTLFYLNSAVLETDDWSVLLAQKYRVWVLTRNNRISEEDAKASGSRLRLVDTGFPQDLYRLYTLDPGP